MEDTTKDARLVCALSSAIQKHAFQSARPKFFATPQAEGAVPLAERPLRSGSPLIDQTLGGLVPGSVTVVRVAWAEAAVAVTVEMALGVARQGRHVLLTTLGADVRAIVDAAGAVATRVPLDTVRTLDAGRSYVRYLITHTAVEPLAITLASCVPDASAARGVIAGLEARPEVVIVSDADAGGTIEGERLLPAWREAAADVGIPIVLVIAGLAHGWSEPRDAHLELARTHLGPWHAYFIARGIPPFGPASETLGVSLLRAKSQIDLLGRAPVLLRNRMQRPCPERSWTEELRPPIDSATLIRISSDPSWHPMDQKEAQDVLRSLAIMFQQVDFRHARGVRALDPFHVERVIEACGGMEIFSQVLLDAGREREGE